MHHLVSLVSSLLIGALLCFVFYCYRFCSVFELNMAAEDLLFISNQFPFAFCINRINLVFVLFSNVPNPEECDPSTSSGQAARKLNRSKASGS
jgi:hypothetical protein